LYQETATGRARGEAATNFFEFGSSQAKTEEEDDSVQEDLYSQTVSMSRIKER
jgi:hypothetical protein